MAPHHVYRDFLGAETRASLLDWALANEHRFAPSKTEGGYDPAKRVSSVLNDLGPLRPALKARLLADAPAIMAQLGMRPFTPSKVEIEMAAHNQGAHFGAHVDTRVGRFADRLHDRLLSGVYYFHREPKAFSGGMLRIFRFGSTGQGDDARIAPEQNSLAVFPSWATHAVTHVECPSGAFADSRFALNIWIYRERVGGNPNGVSHAQAERSAARSARSPSR
jgi:Rps23 Pro-64 3,4-dihydroxylase Tpa1-like proline 4-hydroxylase